MLASKPYHFMDWIFRIWVYGCDIDCHITRIFFARGCHKAENYVKFASPELLDEVLWLYAIALSSCFISVWKSFFILKNHRWGKWRGRLTGDMHGSAACQMNLSQTKQSLYITDMMKLNAINTVVFTIAYAIKRAKSQLLCPMIIVEDIDIYLAMLFILLLTFSASSVGQQGHKGQFCR